MRTDVMHAVAYRELYKHRERLHQEPTDGIIPCHSVAPGFFSLTEPHPDACKLFIMVNVQLQAMKLEGGKFKGF